MYSSQFGVINPLLGALGLQGLEQNWLSDPKIIMVSVSIPLAWQFIGLYLVILLSGFTSIEREILEAAEVDGATGFARTIHIILPLMKNTINVSLLLCISGGIKIFDQIYALTAGGPGYASSVLAMYGYDVTFQQANYGYGSAISIAMLVISLVVIIILSKVRGATRQDA
jgi:raffinose/stachyose/melibiose transport system permease protein